MRPTLADICGTALRILGPLCSDGAPSAASGPGPPRQPPEGFGPRRSLWSAMMGTPAISSSTRTYAGSCDTVAATWCRVGGHASSPSPPPPAGIVILCCPQQFGSKLQPLFFSSVQQSGYVCEQTRDVDTRWCTNNDECGIASPNNLQGTHPPLWARPS